MRDRLRHVSSRSQALQEIKRMALNVKHAPITVTGSERGHVWSLSEQGKQPSVKCWLVLMVLAGTSVAHSLIWDWWLSGSSLGGVINSLLNQRHSEDLWSHMDFNSLSAMDKVILGQALRAAADGPFFPDWEFHTLFGLERNEVRAIANGWPQPAASSEEVEIAVNGSLNNLLGYPHQQDAVWSRWVSVDRHQLNELFNRLRGLRDESYFDRLR